MRYIESQDRNTIRIVNRRRARVSPLSYGKIAEELGMTSGARLYKWLETRAVEIAGEWIPKDTIERRLGQAEPAA